MCCAWSGARSTRPRDALVSTIKTDSTFASAESRDRRDGLRDSIRTMDLDFECARRGPQLGGLEGERGFLRGEDVFRV